MRVVHRVMTAEKAAEKGYEVSSNGKQYKGDPCRHDHDGWRYMINGSCVACDVARMKRKRGGAEVVSKLLYCKWA